MKQKNNRGASIINALMCVLTFALFSSVVLDSTYSNYESVKSQKEYQQAYLTVSDAVEIFVEGIKGDYLVYNKACVYINGKEVWYNNISDSEYYDVGLNNALYKKDDNSEYSFQRLMEEACTTVSPKSSGTVTHTLNVTITDGSGKAVVNSDIVVEALIKEGGNLYANFYLKDTDLTDNCYLTVEIPILASSLNNPVKIEENKTITIAGQKLAEATVETYEIRYDTSAITVSKGKYSNETK